MIDFDLMDNIIALEPLFRQQASSNKLINGNKNELKRI